MERTGASSEWLPRLQVTESRDGHTQSYADNSTCPRSPDHLGGAECSEQVCFCQSTLKTITLKMLLSSVFEGGLLPLFNRRPEIPPTHGISRTGGGKKDSKWECPHLRLHLNEQFGNSD
ncbi:hypothetical protein H8959_009372 [Pygathrix nigripes]